MPKVWNKRDPNCPKDAVYVGRPSKWGNPYPITKTMIRSHVLALYQPWLVYQMAKDTLDITELRGKDLVCWCHSWNGTGTNPMYCHGDILLELANA